MKLAVIAVAMSALTAEGFAPSSTFNGAGLARSTTNVRASTVSVEMSAAEDFKKAATGALAVFAGLSLFASAPPAEAITRDKLDSLSYTQVKGTGLANRCPDVIGEGTINVGGSAKIVDMCIEPKNFQVLSRVSGLSTGENGIASHTLLCVNSVFLSRSIIPQDDMFDIRLDNRGHTIPSHLDELRHDLEDEFEDIEAVGAKRACTVIFGQWLPTLSSTMGVCFPVEPYLQTAIAAGFSLRMVCMNILVPTFAKRDFSATLVLRHVACLPYMCSDQCA